MPHKVFISHASTDVWVAKQMAIHIRECGADTFLDCEQITHGDDFEERIINESQISDELLVLFTPTAHNRKYVWMEIGMFLGSRKRVVGVLYGITKDEISTDPNTPIALKRIDSVNLNEIDSYFIELRDRVKAKEV